MNTTTKPLYQALNKQRTQGDLIVNPEYNCGIIDSENRTVCDFTASFAYANKIPLQEAKANTQYTALAVNNLHHLVEAMEEFVYNWDALGNANDYTHTATKIKEALNRIS